MTLREYISFWQETYDRHQSRPTTYAAHNYVFKNHIIPGLGATQLSELTSEMVGEFLEERKRFGNHRPGSSGLGEETMRHIHRLLQQCLDKAIRDGLITENPAKAFRYRKSATVKANIMTPLEMEDYLDAAERLGYATMAISSGVDVKTLSSMLGHYSAGFTLDTYTHITNDMQRGAAEKIGGFMESATATTTPEPPDPPEESRCKVIPFEKVG